MLRGENLARWPGIASPFDPRHYQIPLCLSLSFCYLDGTRKFINDPFRARLVYGWRCELELLGRMNRNAAGRARGTVVSVDSTNT